MDRMKIRRDEDKTLEKGTTSKKGTFTFNTDKGDIHIYGMTVNVPFTLLGPLNVVRYPALTTCTP